MPDFLTKMTDGLSFVINTFSDWLWYLGFVKLLVILPVIIVKEAWILGVVVGVGTEVWGVWDLLKNINAKNRMKMITAPKITNFFIN